MTRFLNLGGELIDLYADYEYARGDENNSDLRTVSKILKTTQQITNQVKEPSIGTFEGIGGFVGLGVGIYVGAVTLPVAAVDGPLPIFDLAWAYSTARFTKRSVETGRRVGKIFD